jgi:hypothetical protein
MTQQIEDRLRAAFREKADRIPPVAPPLNPERLARAATTADRWQLAHSRRKLVVGLAAAAAVIAIAVTISVASVPPAPPRQPTAGPAAAGPVAALPPYYVAIIMSGPNPMAVVRVTRTGAVIASIPVPRPYQIFQGVTAAADDRTFVLEAESASKSAPAGTPAVRFYLLRLAPAASTNAERARLTPLRVNLPPPGMSAGPMALSPDGTELAVLADENSSAQPIDNHIIVFNLVTGASHDWSDYCRGDCSIHPVAGPANMNTITWTADGRELGFVQFAGKAGHQHFRLLNVDASGSDVVADSRLAPLHAATGVLQGAAPGDIQWFAALVTPDGRSVIIDAAMGSVDVEQTLLRYSARTGAPTAVLGFLPQSGLSHQTAVQVLWTSPDGSTILVTGARGQISAGLLHGGHYTPIPWSPLLQDAAW